MDAKEKFLLETNYCKNCRSQCDKLNNSIDECIKYKYWLSIVYKKILKERLNQNNFIQIWT